MDIIGIETFGLRSARILPADLKLDVIYGTSVLAPCSGTVALVTDNVADMPVSQMDRDNMTRNSVIVDCNRSLVLLAHFAPESIIVKQGPFFQVEAEIGLVGNSGNTGERSIYTPRLKCSAAEPSSLGRAVRGHHERSVSRAQ